MVNDFIFDGKALSDFGYICFLEDEEYIAISNMTFETIKGAQTDASQQVGYSYEEPYSTTLTIIKNHCDYNGEELFLTRDDISEMVRWLSQKQYKWFRFIDTDDNDEIWYRVQIKINKYSAGDNCIGLQLVITANAPYGYTKEITKTVLSGETEFEIPIMSDEYGEFYPNVRVVIDSDGDFSIRNETASAMGVGGYITSLNNCIADEQITFYGENIMQIESTNTHDYGRDFNYKFPVLVTPYSSSNNVIRITGVFCTIIYSYRGIRKVGFE